MGVDLTAVLDKEEVTDSGHPIYAHIIERADDDERSAATIILEARIYGTAVTALCGYTWVPSRNPENHPLCPKCEEIYEFAKDLKGD